ncbi:hypothetical protein [Rubellicoccus peritrichatus]|uniref:Uncharacterized protein n=1 Tax=Rubellicoccus peritrichatus TaxID=3080537 RepID=A0AAQ3L9H6_9BACT|nr:hypothetical protein [Puniceicoccus sp. CR14]WOO41127.1 hypothetical protein RZN69_21105 [Puniceicoccus sp. CR14]
MKEILYVIVFSLQVLPLLAVEEVQAVLIESKIVSGDLKGEHEFLSMPRITVNEGVDARVGLPDSINLTLNPTITDEGIEVIAIFSHSDGIEGTKHLATSDAKSLLSKLSGYSDAPEQSESAESSSEAFPHYLRMAGLFALGKESISISLEDKRDGSSQWIGLGQTKNGITLVSVDLVSSRPSAIIVKGNESAKVFLKSKKIVPISSSIFKEVRNGFYIIKQKIQPDEEIILDVGESPNGQPLTLMLSASKMSKDPE